LVLSKIPLPPWSTLFPYTTLFRSLVVVGLVAHRVPAGIFRFVDVARLGHALPDRRRRGVVARLGRADVIVVRAVEALDHLAEDRSEEHTSELQSLAYRVCRLLLEK